jgi:ribosome-binding protein aMBF1 (putative translation factor)
MDTIGRIKEIGDEIAAISAEAKQRVDALQAERAELVGKARSEEGWSLGQLAEELDLSRTRVQQLQDGQPSNAERQRRAKAKRG